MHRRFGITLGITALVLTSILGTSPAEAGSNKAIRMDTSKTTRVGAIANPGTPAGPDGLWSPVTGYTYVRFHTATDSQWPVTNMANTWNNYLAVNHAPFRFLSVTTCAGEGTKCFEVISSSACGKTQDGSPGGGAFTTQSIDSGGYLYSIKITFLECNSSSTQNSSLYDSRARSMMVSHELGHVLGLNHQPPGGPIDFMEAVIYPFPGSARGYRWWPTTNNINGLKWLYDF